MSALPLLWWVEVWLQAIADTFYVFHLLSGWHYWRLNYALIPTSCPLINYQIDPLIRLGDGQWKACGYLWRIVGWALGYSRGGPLPAECTVQHLVYKKYFDLYLRNCKFLIFRVNFKMHEFAVEADSPPPKFLVAHDVYFIWTNFTH